MRAAIYTRVSTSEQVQEGFSLDAQFHRLRAYCESQGWSIVDIYTDDGISAKNTERPQLRRMLDDIKNKLIDVVLVYKLDRLTRNVTDLYQLIQTFEKYNVGFKSATEVFDTTTAMGRLFITIVAALAQWERENLAERTKMGQIEMTRQGRWSGGHAAFGYDHDENGLSINESQARIVREIYRRYTHGDGTTKILQWLNDTEHPQRAPNKRWTQWAVKYVLRNPLYAGYVRYGYRTSKGRRQPDYIVCDGQHPAIIDKEMFERAETVRQERTKIPTRSGTGTYAFSGLLHCGLCGSNMVGRTQYRTRKGDSPARRYYVCTERQHSGLCDMPHVRESVIDELILAKMSEHQQVIAQFVDSDDETDVNTRLKQSIEREMSKLKDAKQRFLDAFGAGKMDIDILNSQLKRIDDQERKLMQQLDEDEQQIDYKMVHDLLETTQTLWSAFDVSTKKESARRLIERIDVMPTGDITVKFR